MSYELRSALFSARLTEDEASAFIEASEFTDLEQFKLIELDEIKEVLVEECRVRKLRASAASRYLKNLAAEEQGELSCDDAGTRAKLEHFVGQQILLDYAEPPRDAAAFVAQRYTVDARLACTLEAHSAVDAKGHADLVAFYTQLPHLAQRKVQSIGSLRMQHVSDATVLVALGGTFKAFEPFAVVRAFTLTLVLQYDPAGEWRISNEVWTEVARGGGGGGSGAVEATTHVSVLNELDDDDDDDDRQPPTAEQAWLMQLINEEASPGSDPRAPAEVSGRRARARTAEQHARAPLPPQEDFVPRAPTMEQHVHARAPLPPNSQVDFVPRAPMMVSSDRDPFGGGGGGGGGYSSGSSDSDDDAAAAAAAMPAREAAEMSGAAGGADLRRDHVRVEREREIGARVRELKARKTVFVGNIHASAQEHYDELMAIFTKAGVVVDLRMIESTDTGRLKGFGFCRYDTEAEAHLAIAICHDHLFLGRHLRVETSGGAPGPRGASGGRTARSSAGSPPREEAAPRAAATAAAAAAAVGGAGAAAAGVTWTRGDGSLESVVLETVMKFMKSQSGKEGVTISDRKLQGWISARHGQDNPAFKKVATIQNAIRRCNPEGVIKIDYVKNKTMYSLRDRCLNWHMGKCTRLDCPRVHCTPEAYERALNGGALNGGANKRRTRGSGRPIATAKKNASKKASSKKVASSAKTTRISSVFVSPIDESFSDEVEFNHLFASNFDGVRDVSLPNGKRFGFVNFKTVADADRAIAASKTLALPSSPLRLLKVVAGKSSGR